MDVSQHVQSVMERIRQAALAAGREPGEITLCAATKVQTDETIRAAIAAGVRVCGENRVQELVGPPGRRRLCRGGAGPLHRPPSDQ